MITIYFLAVANTCPRVYYTCMKRISGVSKGGLRVLEHPRHNSQISSSVAPLYADNQQLVARTNNELKLRSVSNVLGAVA